MKKKIFNNTGKPKTLTGIICLSVLFIFLITAMQGCLLKPLPIFKIISGSENKALEQIIKDYGKKNGINFDITYKGSVDIMLMLESGQIEEYDAAWPANSLWINLGDKNRLMKYTESIMRSPVVLAVKKPVAQKLGWIGNDVTMEQILEASESGVLRLMMTSATQSNSGASAYFSFLYAFAGNPDILATSDLEDPDVRDKVKRILGSIDRSSESSGWLKDLFIENYGSFDAMFNYESLLIEANQQLIENGMDPLYAIYPVDGLAIADHPLGLINKDNKENEEIFLKLQQYLLSEDVQNQILSFGRRVGILGLNPEAIDTSVFNPEWGIDAERVLSPIRFPESDVIRQALDLYQTTLRKSSLTVYCLDFSPSMEDNGGRQQLIIAMETLLDQEIAGRYLLQATEDDINTVLVFSDYVLNINDIDSWTVRGNDAGQLNELFLKIKNQPIGNRTNIYQPVIAALEYIEKNLTPDYFPAVILMTDGLSNTGEDLLDLEEYIKDTGFSVPVYAVTFGEASEDQLEPIIELTSGQIFDGKKDLVSAFRKAKGNN